MDIKTVMCVIDDEDYTNEEIRKQYEKRLIDAIPANIETHGVYWSALVSLDGRESVRWQGVTYEKRHNDGF